MRLFIGIELDDRVRAAAAAVAGRLERRLRSAAPQVSVRWIPAPNLHITLVFIGEVDDPRAAAVTDAVSSAPFGTAPFDVSPAGCGVFPPGGAPRVLWIGLREGGPGMSRLQAEVSARLDPLGFEPEPRGYTAHLTIGRVKEAGRGSSRPVRDVLAGEAAECGTSRVAAVTVFRSRLSPRGAAYEALVRVPLSGDHQGEGMPDRR